MPHQGCHRGLAADTVARASRRCGPSRALRGGCTYICQGCVATFAQPLRGWEVINPELSYSIRPGGIIALAPSPRGDLGVRGHWCENSGALGTKVRVTCDLCNSFSCENVQKCTMGSSTSAASPASLTSLHGSSPSSLVFSSFQLRCGGVAQLSSRAHLQHPEHVCRPFCIKKRQVFRSQVY